MYSFSKKRQCTFSYRIISFFIVLTFITSLVVPPTQSFAQSQTVLGLPAPGSMVHLGPDYTPALLRGVTINPQNPLEFDFIVHSGDSKLRGNALKSESEKLIKYFLASLTVPEDDMWVNLSPYEGDRIIPEQFGVTEMGRDLLAQDYMLKQLTASLIYPEDDLGKKFWDKVHKEAKAKYGATDIPINTFNKVWIIPESSSIYETGNTALVLESRLKVMLEEDYLSLKSNINNEKLGTDRIVDGDIKQLSSISSKIVKEIIIPALEKEVNEGENFAQLRQIYTSVILATWYKQALKESLLGKVYVDQTKTAGVDVADKAIKQKIYEQYLDAFERGVFDFIKEDYDADSQQLIPRKYFSGGTAFSEITSTRFTPEQPPVGSAQTALRNLGVAAETGSDVYRARTVLGAAQQGLPQIPATVPGVAASEITDFATVQSKYMGIFAEAGRQETYVRLVDNDGTIEWVTEQEARDRGRAGDFSVPVFDVDSPVLAAQTLSEIVPDLQDALNVEGLGRGNFRMVYVNDEVAVKTSERYGAFDSQRELNSLLAEYTYHSHTFAGNPFTQPIAVLRFGDSLFIVEERGKDAVHEIRSALVRGETERADKIVRDMAAMLRFFYDIGEIPGQFDALVGLDGEIVLTDALSHSRGGSEDSQSYIVDWIVKYATTAPELTQDQTDVEAGLRAAFRESFENPEGNVRYQQLVAAQDVNRQLGDAALGVRRNAFSFGLRDISSASSGAFTGQNSKALAHDVGAEFVLIDEPRTGDGTLTGEDNRDVALKIERALKRSEGQQALSPIIRMTVPQSVVDQGGDAIVQYLRTQLGEKLAGFAGNLGSMANASIVAQVVNADGIVLDTDVERRISLVNNLRRLLGEYAPEAAQIRVLVDGENVSINDIEEYVNAADGIYIDPKTARSTSVVVDILRRFAEAYENKVAATPSAEARRPLVVTDMTQTYGQQAKAMMDAIKTAVESEPRLRRLQTVAIPTNLDLRRAGQVINNGVLYDVQEQDTPTNIHFSLQSLEDMSPEYLQAAKADGFTYVLLHHSERRRYHGVTAEFAGRQARAVLDAGLIPVIAIGERERTGDWQADLEQQVRAVLSGIRSEDELARVRLAYEPIAFIGGGQSMTPIQIVEATDVIARGVKERMSQLRDGGAVSEEEEIPVGILYGGSVKPSSVYGQSGGWEQNSLLTALRRLKRVVGGLVGTRSLIPGDPDRIADRFAENALAKGKPVRGETGGNWKMEVHTLEDAERRVEAFMQNIRGNEWKGEFYFAVPPSMGEPLARKFRGKHAPRQISTLDMTSRQQAMNSLIDRFWTWWEDNGQDTTIESLDSALRQFYIFYIQDDAIHEQGVSWFAVFQQAVLSNLFVNEKVVTPAANILANLRFAPLAEAVLAIEQDDLREAIAGVVGDAAYYHNLSAGQKNELRNVLADNFGFTDYERKVLEYVVTPENIVTSGNVGDEYEGAYFQDIAAIARYHIDRGTESPERAVVSALWHLRDIVLNPNVSDPERSSAKLSILQAADTFEDSPLIQRNFAYIIAEIGEDYEKQNWGELPTSEGPVEDQLIDRMQELASVRSQPVVFGYLGGLRSAYAAAVLALTSETTDEAIESYFEQRAGLFESDENAILDELRDTLQIERDPARFVTEGAQVSDELLETVNYVRIFEGGLLAYLARSLKLQRDALLPVSETAERPQATPQPIQRDKPTKPYSVELVEAANVAIDVSGAFGRGGNLSLRNTADNLVRRALGSRRGQGFDPNFNLTTIYGINSESEFAALVGYLVANAYHGRSEFTVGIRNQYQNGVATIEVADVNGNVKLIRVKAGAHTQDGGLDLGNVIVLTDQDPAVWDRDNVQQRAAGYNVHVVNPNLDTTVVGAGKVQHYNTALTDALSPLFAALEGQYGLTGGVVLDFVKPGDSRNLHLVSTEAARNLQWDGQRTEVTIKGQPQWESHNHEGAGFVQIYLTFENEADVEEVTKYLKSVHLNGYPVHFAENYVPNSLSVQARNQALVLDKNISVQGNGRMVTLRAWIPDWVQADNVLTSVKNLGKQQQIRSVNDLDIRLAARRQSIALEQEEIRRTAERARARERGALTVNGQRNIGIYGADEVVAGNLIRQLRGEEGIVVRSVYIEETTQNPLEPKIFVAYLRQLMPDADIYVGDAGDTIVINGSSPIKMYIGKEQKKKGLPNWAAEGVETVVVADKWAQDPSKAIEFHKELGAQKVLMAANPRTPITTVVSMAEEVLGDLKEGDAIVQTNSAIDPFRGRSHDIVVGNKVMPSPFANLLPEVSPEGNQLDVQSGNYDTNVTAVTFTLSESMTQDEARAEIVRRFREAAAGSLAGKLEVVGDDFSLTPSLTAKDAKAYFDPSKMIVQGRTVTVLLGYDFANLWAAQLVEGIKSGREDTAVARTERPRRVRGDRKIFEPRANEVDTIPAPAAPAVKRVTGPQRVVSRVGVDLTDLPYDGSSRNALDYFADSLIYSLIGDERVSISLYGVQNAENLLFLYQNIRKRLPKNATIFLNGFDEGDSGKFKRDLETQGFTYLNIETARIKVWATPMRELMDNQTAFDRENIDTLLVVTDQDKAAKVSEFEQFSEQYGLSGVKVVNPERDGLELVKGKLLEELQRSRTPYRDLRVISTRSARTSEQEISVDGEVVTIRTPTRLEGDFHNFIIEFSRDRTREEVIDLVRSIQANNRGVVEILPGAAASIDLVNNPHEAVISEDQVEGSGRLWSIPIWTGETGLAQNTIESLVEIAGRTENQRKAKAAGHAQTMRNSTIPSIPASDGKATMIELAAKGRKADILISAVAGRTGKNMLLAAIGDPNVNLLGVTLNRPDEDKVIATVSALNNDTVYGRPGIIFDYGGWDERAQAFVIWAGDAQTGWKRINVYDGSKPRSLPVQQWRDQGFWPQYLYAVGSGYHRFKEKDLLEIGFGRVQYGNPGKGQSLQLIPGSVDWQDPLVRELILQDEITCLGSCTTGAGVGPLFWLAQFAEFVSGVTLHELTNDQDANDGPLHDAVERTFAAARTTVLSTSGAGSAIAKSVKELVGLSTANALREGYGGASALDLTIKLKPEQVGVLTPEQVKSVLREALKQPDVRGVLHLHEEPYFIDADEVKGIPASSVVDLNTIRIVGDKLTFTAWYDNERAFSGRMIHLAKQVSIVQQNGPSDLVDVGPGGAASSEITNRIPLQNDAPLGGIDLNPANLNLQIKRDGKGIPLPLPMQDLDNIRNIDGFFPVIIDLKPVTNLPLILGGTEEAEEEFDLTKAGALN